VTKQTLSSRRTTEVGENASATSIEPSEIVYQQLQLLNHHCFCAIQLIKTLGQGSFIPDIETEYYRACLEEVRSSSSQCVVEALNDLEIKKAARAGKKRTKAKEELFADAK
jgi:hypothetical protein